MTDITKKLAKKLDQKRLTQLAELKGLAQVRGGWVRFIRKALGMTQSDLASRVGLSTMAITQTERREQDQKINLATLAKIAEAMDCEFVYAFVPRNSLDEIIDKAATKKAKKILAKTMDQMELEDQSPQGLMEERLQLLKDELKSKGNVW